jgi:Tol biopolymer transport system component
MGLRQLVYALSALLLLTILGPGGLQAGGPDWQIIAQVQSNNGFKLMQFGSDGSKTQLTQTRFAGAPSLSPDGQSVFFSEIGESEGEEESLIQIFRLDLRTKQLTRISDGSANDDLPVCSADGKRLAFASKPNDNHSKWLLYVMDVDGKNRQQVEFAGKNKNTVFPCWSPDGTKIAYFQPLFVFGSLHIADLQKKTTASLLPFWWLFNNFPSWSPNGDRIAFSDWSPLTRKATIWVAKPDGSDRRRLTDGPEDKHPSWSPDQRQIVFTRDGIGKTAICSVDLETLEVKTLVESAKGEVLYYPKVLPKPPLAQSQVSSN